MQGGQRGAQWNRQGFADAGNEDYDVDDEAGTDENMIPTIYQKFWLEEIFILSIKIAEPLIW